MILGLSHALSAQTNVIRLSDLSDQTVAYASNHPSKMVHHGKFFNPEAVRTDHDTVKYVLIVDAADHLDIDDTTKKVTTEHEISFKPNVGIKIDQILASNDILFDYRSHRLTVESKKILDKLAGIMLQHPTALFEIGAHTDARGLYHENMELSQKRVNAAIQYLTEKGVNKDQLIGVAYGEAILKNVCDSDSHCSEEVHAGNRRIEIKILSLGN